MISPAELRELFTYDPETGELRNRVTRNSKAPAGALAGSYDSKGYRQVAQGGRCYKVHRIIWAMVYDRWPEHEIDHINGVKDDNRLANLREATSVQNSWNSKVKHHSTSGWKGVHPQGNRWCARIRVNGKRVTLGTFKYKLEAAVAYAEAAAKYHGEFART